MFFHLSREAGGPLSMSLERGCQQLLQWELGPQERIELLGDPVLRHAAALPQSILGSDGRIDQEKLYDQIPGHYHWFHWRADAVECGSSFCGLLPMYYRNIGGRLDISSSSVCIARLHGLTADDEGYRLERELFNYPLFERTPWSGIKLLPAHGRLLVEGGSVSVSKGFAIEEHFGSEARSSVRDMEELVAAFNVECELLLPKTGFALSFTGGFDGRTLLGAALKLGRSGFSTYGFGRPGESDIALPERQARELGVPYTPILLDERYVREDALPSALAFMELSEFTGNLGRPHYHYAARLLSGRHAHLVTGNFGSELFRALHLPGPMMSAHLIRIFRGAAGSWRDALLQAAGKERGAVAEALIDRIAIYLDAAKGSDPTKRFYRFVFEELFRKYFGPEIMVQNHFLSNRTPFLSLRFVKSLHRTAWAGVHARLFETDKVRRMKGQVFYGEYLKRADTRLYRMLTNKGYAPRDLIEPWRLPLLVARSAWKRIAGTERVDSNSVEAFYRAHREAILAHYWLQDDAADDLQTLSNRVAWAAASIETT